MRLASSWMVITSGMITSRMTLSRGCTTPAWRSFSRSRRRLQRGQRALALRLVEGVVDGELDALAPLVADLDRALRRPWRPSSWRATSSSASASISSARAPRLAICSTRCGASPTLAFSAGARLGLGSSASWPRRRRCRLGRLGLRLRRTAAEPAPAFASSGSGFGPQRLEARALALLGLGALLRGLERAPARIELVGGQPAGPLHHLGRADAPASACARGVLGLSPPPGAEIVRFFFFSTTTDFERPWLKLCWTWPDSTVRFRLSGLRGARRAASSRWFLSSRSCTSCVGCTGRRHATARRPGPAGNA